MKISKNNGTCLLCKQDVEHRMIVKHINKCLEKHILNDPSEKEKIFLIKVYMGKYFWLYLEINGSSSLEKLDSFLRYVWVECCDHMSQFIINGERYSSDRGMNKVIHRTLPEGTEFNYEYDFGSTTELEGKVISFRKGKLKEDIRLLARNHLPADILCVRCKKTPDVICSICNDFYCEGCQKNHDGCCEGEEFMFPVVNSPRMGICGYTGQD